MSDNERENMAAGSGNGDMADSDQVSEATSAGYGEDHMVTAEGTSAAATGTGIGGAPLGGQPPESTMPGTGGTGDAVPAASGAAAAGLPGQLSGSGDAAPVAAGGTRAAGVSRQGPGPVARLTERGLPVIIGIVGALVALVIDILYALAHVLGRVAGMNTDSSHFFGGLGVVLVAFIGALLAAVSPLVGAVLLVVAAIGFFFVVGWWAVIAAPFLLGAAYLAYRYHEARQERSIA